MCSCTFCSAPSKPYSFLRCAVRELRPADVEVVAFLRHHDHRLRGHRAGSRRGPGPRQDARRALLGVGRQFVFQVARNDVTKQLGAAIVQRGSTPQSHVVIVPPPELPVMPTCCGSTSGDQQVVERPHAVPRPPRAEELADEELLVAAMKCSRDADADVRFCRCSSGYCSRSPWPIGSKISTT